MYAFSPFWERNQGNPKVIFCVDKTNAYIMQHGGGRGLFSGKNCIHTLWKAPPHGLQGDSSAPCDETQGGGCVTSNILKSLAYNRNGAFWCVFRGGQNHDFLEGKGREVWGKWNRPTCISMFILITESVLT